MNTVRRWPLHPQPGPLESLSSWLERLARPYEIRVEDLLTRNLGLVDVAVPDDLDYDPPAVMLAALAMRTGVEIARLRAMTLASWEPWLIEGLTASIEDTQPVFDAYVRDNSVLLAPGKAGVNKVSPFRRWPGPWLGYWGLHRDCPMCAADPQRGKALVWRLPLVTGCFEHGCRLEDAMEVHRSVVYGHKGPVPTPLAEPLATVDRYTYEGLTTGQVVLPGRTVHAGVWFRLLRSLLDEVSLSATSGRGKHGRAVLEHIWQATGRKYRAGLNIWRPYENLKPDIQEAMLHAAGTALHLVADGTITARGRLASALRPPPDQYVYDGDRPRRGSWLEEMVRWETVLAPARTDRDAARRLLSLLTQNSPLRWFEEERAFLIDAGVPANFLPTARELGRTTLA
ncbi:TniQ family protein [Streptomyces sp. UNOC14_S4]|uniref:TniQ family protein n=1 Tax=Streptomyces sp. UNOC14_S4 TaxID=2872340 RepID=UPI0027E33B35|nr:TniQ family protein [Streptomyces sp. UNOC14_S4]